MFEVQDWIYSLRDYKVESKIPEKLVVAVHPFYFDRHEKGKTEEYQKYIEKRDKFFKQFNESVLIFEEEGLDFNSGYRACFPKTKNLFFIETWEDNPHPSHISWEEVFKFVNRFRKPVSLMGGQYWVDNDDGDEFYRGCLGYTMDRFIEGGFNPRILKGLTFS